MGIEVKLKRWKQYIEELFCDDRPDSLLGVNFEFNEEGQVIMKDEVLLTIKTQKNTKATVPGNINAELN